MTVDPDPAAFTGSPGEPLSVEEIRSRSLRGAKLVLFRGLAVKGIVFVGSLALARLLGPAEFGVVAIGLAALAFAGLLSDGGLGAGLIRRVAEPLTDEYRSLVGWQLLVTTAVATPVLVGGVIGGGTPLFVGVMLLAMPIAVLQLPGAVALERSLRFGPRVVVELAEAVVWTAVAVTLVAAGAGIWGIAAATVVRPVAGLVTMSWVAPICFVRPRLVWSDIRELLAFGLKFQLVAAINLGRDQGLNVLVLGLGGLTGLGLWSLAFRVLQVPYLVLESLWRVSFPAMARLVGGGHDVDPVLRSTLRLVATGNAVLLVGLASAGPRLVPAIFGDEWASAGSVLVPACAGLLLGGPISVTAAGYLYASDRSDIIIRAGVVQSVAWLAVTAALWHSLAVTAVGWGWLAAGLADAFVLGQGLRRVSGSNPLGSMLRPVVLAIVAGAAGIFAAREGASDLVGATAGGVVGVATFVGLVLIFDKAAARQLRTLVF